MGARKAVKGSAAEVVPRPWELPRGAVAKLRAQDAALGRLMKRVGPPTVMIGNVDGHMAALLRSIVFQQLSGKAATTIFDRVRGLFPAARFPSAGEVLAKSDAELRGCGLSGQKLGYVRDLCSRVADGRLDFAALPDLSDDEVIQKVTEVKGIGRWTAEMFLMFHLGRLDVWPVDDLGIRKGVGLLHGHAELPTAKQLEPLRARYSPYASVATWYLWRLLELPEEDQLHVRTG